jgi:hypothetical protein
VLREQVCLHRGCGAPPGITFALRRQRDLRLLYYRNRVSFLVTVPLLCYRVLLCVTVTSTYIYDLIINVSRLLYCIVRYSN